MSTQSTFSLRNGNNLIPFLNSQVLSAALLLARVGDDTFIWVGKINLGRPGIERKKEVKGA